MIEKAKLSTKFTKARPDSRVVAQAVRVFLSNKRKALAKSKTRGEVNKTSAKMYKQKGTGKARHGAYSAPIFVGGGVAFGPTGTQNYDRKMSKALNRQAMVSALALKEKKAWIMATENRIKDTKTALKELNKAEINPKGLLLVLGQKELNSAKTFRNLGGIEISNSLIINVYQIMKCKQLLFTQSALEEITKKYVS